MWKFKMYNVDSDFNGWIFNLSPAARSGEYAPYGFSSMSSNGAVNQMSG
jgi:hypothetical protein